MTEPLTERARRASVLAAEWFASNQVPERPYGKDANRGRFIQEYNVATGEVAYSCNWATALGAMACLTAHRLMGEERFIDSAVEAAGYLKTLQLTDSRDPELFGLIREETPRSEFLYPRDAATGAWGLLHVFKATGDADCLDRATLFADWFLANGLASDGWPLREFRIDTKEKLDPRERRAAWQAGCLGFFCDLAREEPTPKLTEAIRRIANMCRDRLFAPDGGIAVPGYVAAAPQETSAFGSDWAMTGFLASGAVLGTDGYLACVRRWLEYAERRVEEDGAISLEEGIFHTGSAFVANAALEYEYVTGDGRFRPLAERCAEILMSIQDTASADPRLLGGLRSSECTSVENDRDMIAARVTGYSSVVLAKLAGTAHIPFYSAKGYAG